MQLADFRNEPFLSTLKGKSNALTAVFVLDMSIKGDKT